MSTPIRRAESAPSALPDAGMETVRAAGRAEQRALRQRSLDRMSSQLAFENALQRSGQPPAQEPAATDEPPRHPLARLQGGNDTASAAEQAGSGTSATAAAAAAAAPSPWPPADRLASPREHHGIEAASATAQASAAPLQRADAPAVEPRGRLPEEPAIDPTRLRGSPDAARPDRWRFELAGAPLPVQQLTVQRLSPGTLGVSLQWRDRASELQLAQPLQRLNQRLASQGATLDPGEADA